MAKSPTSAKVITASAVAGGISQIVPDLFIIVQAILPGTEEVSEAGARVIVAGVVYGLSHVAGFWTRDNRSGQPEPEPEPPPSEFEQVTTEKRIQTLEGLAEKWAPREEDQAAAGVT